MLQLISREVPRALQPHVHSIMGYAERTFAPVVRNELAAPMAVMIIELGPPISVAGERHRGGFLAGVGDLPTHTEHSGFQRGIQINLSPTGARRLFGIPMHELTNRAVRLGDLMEDLSARLCALPNWGQRFELIERVLLARLQGDDAHTRLVEWAAARVWTTDMKTLAKQLGYSQKHMITLFKEHVGVTPKVLQQLQRFERLVARIKSGVAFDWATLALELGYFDQSHLHRDVRRFAGSTPTALVNFVQDVPQPET